MSGIDIKVTRSSFCFTDPGSGMKQKVYGWAMNASEGNWQTSISF
jgi:hypothetical protein